MQIRQCTGGTTRGISKSRQVVRSRRDAGSGFNQLYCVRESFALLWLAMMQRHGCCDGSTVLRLMLLVTTDVCAVPILRRCLFNNQRSIALLILSELQENASLPKTWMGSCCGVDMKSILCPKGCAKHYIHLGVGGAHFHSKMGEHA